MDCISNKMQPLIAWMGIGCFQCDSNNRKIKSSVLSVVDFMTRQTSIVALLENFDILVLNIFHFTSLVRAGTDLLYGADISL